MKNRPRYSVLIVTLLLFGFFIVSNSFGQRDKLSSDLKRELNENDKLIESYLSSGEKAQAASFLNKSAFLLMSHQIYEEAITYFKRALELTESMNNKKGAMIINYNLGMIYSDLERYSEALPYLKEGLRYSRMMNEKESVISGLSNTAMALQGVGKHQEALKYLEEGIGLSKEINDLKLLRRCYGQAYESYEAIGESEQAFKYFEIYNSLDKKIKREEMEFVKSQAKSEVNQAHLEKLATELELQSTEASLEREKRITKEQRLEIELERAKSREQEAINREQEAQIKTEKTRRNFALLLAALILVFFIVLFYQFRQKQKANKLLAKQKIEIEGYSRELEKTNIELEKLSIVASETDNAVIITDDKGNFEWVNNGYTRMFGYTFEQLVRERQNNIIVEDTPEDVKAVISQCFSEKIPVSFEQTIPDVNGNEITVNTTLTPILDNLGRIKKLIAIDSDISKIKAAEKEILMQRDRLHVQNQQIKASIRYAVNIQQAILPDVSEIGKYFESFVLYRPKDIVSGDFYWYSHFDANGSAKEDISFIAAVDCTGHGVPGAFMSMIGNRLLNEIVNEKKIFDPAEILELMNKEVRLALRQEQTDNNDGMDICLCKIVKNGKASSEVVFSGAKRPLFIVRNGSDEPEQLKGDRKSIGGFGMSRESIVFTNQSVVLKKGDMIYLTSDGIIDQNGPDRKRYGSRKLMDMLAAISDEPIEKQFLILNNDLDQFMQQEEQRDDITLIGVKL